MLPSNPHPAVNAFRNALQAQIKSDCNGDGNDQGRNRRSEAIRKATLSLGWRNRFSQSNLYPVELNYNSCDKDKTISRKTETIQIRQVQRGEIENTFGTGATVWPASIVLLKYLEHLLINGEQSSKNLFRRYTDRNQRVTVADLGSGTGVTSIAAAFYLGLNKSHYNRYFENSLIVCTDGVDSVVQLAKENIANVAKQLGEENEMEQDREKNPGLFQLGQNQVKVRKYLWGDGSLTKELITDDKNLDCKGLFFDIILVSDCVLPKLYPIEPLVNAIDELTGPSTVAYISYEYRYYPEYDPKQHFINLAEMKGLDVETIPIDSHHPIYSAEDIEIWEVRRKQTENIIA